MPTLTQTPMYVDHDQFHLRLATWCEALTTALHAKHQHAAEVGTPLSTHFECQAPRKGQKFVRIVEVRGGKVSSVHAFYDQRNGDVYKPAGFKAPAKHVRYNLLDDASWQDMIGKIRAGDWAGGYLYMTGR